MKKIFKNHNFSSFLFTKFQQVGKKKSCLQAMFGTNSFAKGIAENKEFFH
jgi:hypothetical protein